MPFKPNHGKILGDTLERLNISNIELSKSLGSSVINISNLINKKSFPKRTIAALCFVLDVDPDIFSIKISDLKVSSSFLNDHYKSSNIENEITQAGGIQSYIKRYFQLKSSLISNAKRSIYILHSLDPRFDLMDENHSQLTSEMYGLVQKNFLEKLTAKILALKSSIEYKVIFQLHPSSHMHNEYMTSRELISEMISVSIIKHFEALHSYNPQSFKVYYLEDPMVINRFILVDENIIMRDFSVNWKSEVPFDLLEVNSITRQPRLKPIIESYSKVFQLSQYPLRREFSRDDFIQSLRLAKSQLENKLSSIDKELGEITALYKSESSLVIGDKNKSLISLQTSFQGRIERISKKIDLLQISG